MKYQVSHTDTIEANSKEEAAQAYVESWRDRFYSEDDLDITEEDKGGAE